MVVDAVERAGRQGIRAPRAGEVVGDVQPLRGLREQQFHFVQTQRLRAMPGGIGELGDALFQ